MILKGSQRGGGKQLALHLLKTSDNEHVHVHELRGFMADDLQSAFHEAYAVSRGTKARQYLFSLSLNPPAKERVPTSVFESAIDAIEQKLGLSGQPRAIVFHEKDGRRHAHAVWSRIDAEQMKAINLPHYKLKLRDVSKQLFLEHGWQLPRGFVSSKERDPASFTHAEWEQAKRAGHDPRALKAMFRECWAASDSGKAFAQALAARGYTLARGDRRGFVALDFRGEVYAVAKYAGIRTKDVRSRLGDAERLPSVDEARTTIAGRMSAMLRRHAGEIEARQKRESATFAFRRGEIVQRQRDERAVLERAHHLRSAKENLERAQRISKGFRGLWDRITGRHAEVKRQNEREALQSFYRDRAEKDALIFRHIEERQALHLQARQMREAQSQKLAALQRDIAGYMNMAKGPPDVKEHFRQAHGPMRPRGRKRDRDREPEFER